MKTLLILLVLTASLRSEVTEYWMYLPTNLLVDEKRDETISLLQRASSAGYTHCLIADSKFSRLRELPERYFSNVEKVMAAAVAAKIELVPTVCPV